MGTTTDGLLAYGFNLGAADDWKVHGLGKYGELPVTWHTEDGDFAENAARMLLRGTGRMPAKGYHHDPCGAIKKLLGVEIVPYCSPGYPMYLLAAHTITVHRGDTRLIDPAELTRAPLLGDWDNKLTGALVVLGLRPTQERAGWLLCSDQG